MYRSWKRRWMNIIVFFSSILCLFNLYAIFRILSPYGTNRKNLLEEKNRHHKFQQDSEDGEVNFIPETSVCAYRTATHIDGMDVQLNRPPFHHFTKNMKCFLNGFAAIFGQEFAVFNTAILDPDKINRSSISARGGEKIDDVWDQPEEKDYLSLFPGYFTIPCKFPPVLNFDETDFKFMWAKILRCHSHFNNNTDALSANSTKIFHHISGTTIAITRYEYANFYHTLTDIYNTFVLQLLLSQKGERVNVLFMDAHPESRLDIIWSNLFGKIMRAGRLQLPVTFEKLVWGIQGYRSPLNDHHSLTVPYLEEFRHFFLTRHGVNSAIFSNHVLDCRHLKALVIWRHDHATHPRNKLGQVVRKFSNENEILKIVRVVLRPLTSSTRDVNDTEIAVGMVLETMEMKQQLTLVSNCDILIGMHGAGLSHTLFLTRSSGLLELLPSYSSPDLIHFQAMARWRGIGYERWHNVERAMDKDRSETYVRPHIMRKLVKSIRQRICPGA